MSTLSYRIARLGQDVGLNSTSDDGCHRGGRESKAMEEKIEWQRRRLARAIGRGRSLRWCLRLWSEFIRERDAHRCVSCDAVDGLEAHHVFRRALFPRGALELGNGITLCRKCHGEVHEGFNGTPDLSLPIGAQGADDQDVAARLYGLLREDASERGLNQDSFYFIGDHMLEFFMRVQGYRRWYDLVRTRKISRIRFAHEIWRVMPEAVYTQLFRAVLSEPSVQSDSIGGGRTTEIVVELRG